MADYQLELRQIVDYPRCRIYREFIQTLIADRSIRTGGCSGLFYYVVLCSYANFRTSYRRIDGISYTVYPGEWICSITDITKWFRVRFHYQAFAILKSLQDRQLITFTRLGRGHIVKFSITDWRRNNTALDYIGEGDSICEISHELVLDNWQSVPHTIPQECPFRRQIIRQRRKAVRRR